MRKVADYIDGCFVEIYEKAIRNDQKTEKEGVAVFDSVPYVRIKPTNSKDVFDQPLNDEKKRRYADLFAKFESGEKVTVSGWPIEEWAQLDATQVATLKSAGILTVQALAELPENSLHRLPNGYISLKNRASDALSQRNSGEQVRVEFEQFRESYDARLSAMTEEITQLTQELAAVKASVSEPPKRKPGRPKKEPAEA